MAAIAGVAARDVVTPHGLDELAQIVGELHVARKPFAFVGGGTHLESGNPPKALDTIVRTTALDEVVEYAPEDQTITVQAGITLAELDRALAPHEQMLPLDAADRTGATIGGTVAVNAYGRRRARYGTAKDMIVGVRMVRPDGTLARGGGKVVKNVAGFDLPKLMVGSLGTLGAIVELTLRLHPVPEVIAAAALQFDDEEKIDAAVRELTARRLEPESVVLYNYRTLVVTFGGTEAGVRAQLRVLLDEIARPYAREAAELSELEREAFEQRERAVRRDGAWRLRVIAPPAVHVATVGAVAASPIAVPVAYPTLGVAFHALSEASFAGDAEAQPDRHIRDLREQVGAATGGAGRVVFDAMPQSARGLVDAWGPPPPSLPLMHALKDAFDPHRLCNAGRFVGGL